MLGSYTQQMWRKRKSSTRLYLRVNTSSVSRETLNSNHDNRVMRNYNSIVSQLRQAQQRNDSHLIDESELNQEIEIKEIEEAIKVFHSDIHLALH